MNLKDALGANKAAAGQKFSVYLPNRDSSGHELTGIDDWIDVALDMLRRINGGATCMAPSFGIWQSKRRKIIQENTRIVYSYITDADRFRKNLPTIRTFIHSFGKECRQGEVLVEFSGEDKAIFVHRAYFVDQYPDAQTLDQVRYKDA